LAVVQRGEKNQRAGRSACATGVGYAEWFSRCCSKAVELLQRPARCLEESANLPDPDVVAAEIAEDLEAALEQFSQIASDLEPRGRS